MKHKLSLWLVLVLCVSAASGATIHWFSDETFTSSPQDSMVIPLQVTGPNGYRYTLLSYLKNYMGAGTTVNITTNYYVYGTNYYVNNSYVSNYFETNILVDATSSNYFATYNYVTNTYQTNVTIEQYLTSNTYVSNYVTTNIYNDTYVSNYFSTNLFPTTYVYVTNTIGGDFIANLNGVGTNTTFYGTSEFKGAGNGIIDLYDAAGTTLLGGFNGTYWWGNGQGLTNLPSTGGSQVWTNDGTFTWLSGYPPPDPSGAVDGPPFCVKVSNGSILIGTNFGAFGYSGTPNILRPIYSISLTASNQLPEQSIELTTADSSDQNYYGTFSASSKVIDSQHTGFSRIEASGSGSTNWSIITLLASEKPVDTHIGIGQHGDDVFYVDGFGNVSAFGVYSGDGSGLTNLNNVIETNVYQTFNVQKLTVQSNLFYLQSRPQINAWSGPTNTLDFSLAQAWTYTALVPISITNIIGITNSYMNSALLAVTNASGSNLTATITASGWKTGIGDSLTWTNGDILQIWPSEMNGMKSIATKAYH